ncbi:MAG: DUF2092 domain-containing protein [Gammaproteobacteria bacterium]
MKINPFSRMVPLSLYLLLVMVIAGCAEQGKMITPEPLIDQARAPQVPDDPAEADAILMRMARYLAGTQRFSVNLLSSYDALQESGQKIDFGERRTITVSRPDGLRVEIERSDGEKHLVLYDGKDITVYDPAQNVYAQTAKPGGIDEAIMYFLRDLQMRLPLAVLLVSRFPEEIESRTLSLDYVEHTGILGTPAHHLAGSTETVDYQVWIAEGDQPLPLYVVLTYKNAEGQPQFRAHFSDWNLSPQIQDSLFAFSPPDGARKISFAAQLPQIALQGGASPESSGEKQ